MTEYIEREAVLKIIGDNCPPDKCGYNTEEEMGAGAACYYIGKDVEKIPTADVVPRSEVEELKKRMFPSYARACTEEEAIKIGKQYGRAEVAMEIFEEIEKKSCNISEHNHATNVTRVVCYQLSANTVAELKKKYTEENDGTRREI